MVARAPLRTLYQPQRSNDNILIWGGDMEASTVTTVGYHSLDPINRLVAYRSSSILLRTEQ